MDSDEGEKRVCGNFERIRRLFQYGTGGSDRNMGVVGLKAQARSLVSVTEWS